MGVWPAGGQPGSAGRSPARLGAVAGLPGYPGNLGAPDDARIPGSCLPPDPDSARPGAAACSRAVTGANDSKQARIRRLKIPALCSGSIDGPWSSLPGGGEPHRWAIVAAPPVAVAANAPDAGIADRRDRADRPGRRL